MVAAAAAAPAVYASQDARDYSLLDPQPQDPKIAYCKDMNRRGDFPLIALDFLDYQFRVRKKTWVMGLSHRKFVGPPERLEYAQSLGSAM
jgi:hypothetical protein